MDEYQLPPLGSTLRILVKLRVACHEALTDPRFNAEWISEEEYDAAGGDESSEVAFLWWRVSCERYFRCAPGTADDSDKIALALWHINNAIALIKVIKQQVILQEQVGVIAKTCEGVCTSSMVAAAIMRRVADIETHREKSRPRNGGRPTALRDETQRLIAEDELRRQLRNRPKPSWTDATVRTSRELRRQKIHVSGKTLGKIFSHLKPEKAK